jgi:hypothetical protein
LEQKEEAAQHLLLSPMTTLSHKYYHWCSEHIKYNHSESSLKMYSKLDKLFRLNYIQLLIVLVTLILPDCTAHVGWVTLAVVGTTGGGGIELIVVVDPDMVTQLGQQGFWHIAPEPSLQNELEDWYRTIHAIFNPDSCYCDCSWWCSTSRLNRSWCRWNRRRKWHRFIVVVEDDMVTQVASAKFLTYNV